MLGRLASLSFCLTRDERKCTFTKVSFWHMWIFAATHNFPPLSAAWQTCHRPGKGRSPPVHPLQT